ncbi:MAG TPA: hypothetical protein VGX21_08255 [Methylomirabilota bacterium]|nr:hypothetical protein [Methylomirabilota bacterium]
MRRVYWALVLGLVAYELVALANRDEGDTISEITWELTARRPLVPFTLGLLMGHFFWQREEPCRKP